VTFNPGDLLTKQFTVPTGNDSKDEPNETFTVALSAPSNTSVTGGPATGTINDNDSAPTAPTISVNSVQIEEGLTASFKVTLSAVSGRTVTVKYVTSNGTAVAPGDYAARPLTTLTFNSGQTTKTVNVTTVEDLLNETNETFTVVLSGAVNATTPSPSGTGTILNDDGPPGLSILDPTPVSEGSGSVEFTVTLLPASGKTVFVNYATANGTATAPADYAATSGTLKFLPGQTSNAIIVPIANDSLDEIAETLVVNLSGNLNASIADAQGMGTILDDVNDNVAPVVSLQTTDQAGDSSFEFGVGEVVKVTVTFTDPGIADTHTVTLDWGDGTAPDMFVISPVGARSFVRTHAYATPNFYQISTSVADADGGSDSGTRFVSVTGSGTASAYRTGLVDTSAGKWYLYDDAGVVVTSFFFGNPGDYPFMGDWDGDGIETPGLYRQSDGFVYLRNFNTQGIANVSFFFGNPGDVPIAGDFNGDGFDTVSIYRPSNQRFYIINALGENGGGLGAADVFYTFGNPGDKPFVGDFDGDGIETVGLHRESNGIVYFRNSHTFGNADRLFTFGNPGDRLVAGDWTGDGKFTPALFRPSSKTMFFRYTNTFGNADDQFVPSPASSAWIPISGVTGF